MTEYYIGQKFSEEYPAEAAEWCMNNNATISEIEPIEGVRRFEIVAINPYQPTDEDIRKMRENAYEAKVDPITAHIQRLRDTVPMTEEVETEIAELIVERDAEVQKIKEHYPYNTGE